MNTCKRLLAFALALVLTLSCLPAQHIHVSATEEETTPVPDVAQPLSVENGIEVDQTIIVDIPGNCETLYIPFTPSQTEYYHFYSDAPQNTDTYGYIFDADMNILAENDDYFYTNFSVSYALEKDTLYYLGARFFSDTSAGSIPVGLRIIHDYVYDSTNNATCMAPADIVFTCIYCDASYTETITVDHSWDEGEITSTATCAQLGEITYRCTTEGCDAARTESYSVEHIFEDGVCINCGQQEGILQLDIPYTVNIDQPGKEVFLQFTPQQNDNYHFFSMTPNNDPFGALYDADMNLLQENDQNDDVNNFGFKYVLEAGKTYYLMAKEYDDSVTSSYPVKVTIAHEYDGKETKPGTCTEPGEWTYTCIHCGHSYIGYSEPSHNFENGQCTGCDEVEILEECFDYYPNEDGTVTIQGYHGSFYHVDVPSQLDGKPVTRIDTFNGSGLLKSVTIPEGVTSLGDSCFAYCGGLESVSLPSTLTFLGHSAFYECICLKEITIPESITSLSDGCFARCEKLARVNLPSTLSTIGKNAFQQCDALKSIDIPDSVTTIGANAFLNCNNLQTVTVGSGVTTMHTSAFFGCDALEIFCLGANINEIQASVFSSPSLHHIFFEGSEEDWSDIAIETAGNERLFDGYITVHCDADGNSALSTREDCTSIYTDCSLCNDVIKQTAKDTLSHQYSPEGVCTVCGQRDGVMVLDTPYSAAITEPNGSVSVEFTAPISEIYTFYVKTKAEMNCVLYLRDYDPRFNIYVPEITISGFQLEKGETVRLEFDFWDTDMTGAFQITANISHGLSSQELQAPTCTEPGVMLYTCAFCDYSYTGPIDPRHNYEDGVCSGCGDLQDLEACFNYYENDDGTITIESYNGSFYNLTIPSQLDGKDVTAIHQDAFYNNQMLRSVVVPEGVTSLNHEVFYDCSNLETVVLPSTIEHIGSYAFANCYKLKNINLPDSLLTIGSSAFYQCFSLEAIDLPDYITEIGSYMFYDCDKLTSITIPEQVWSIGDGAFYSCNALEYVVLSRVSLVSYNAFAHCYNLSHVFYQGPQEERQGISFDGDNSCLTGVTWHYETYSADSLEDRSDCTTRGLYCTLCDGLVHTTPKPAPTHDYNADGVCTICGNRDGYITPDKAGFATIRYPGEIATLLFTPQYTHEYFYYADSNGSDTWGSIIEDATGNELICNDDNNNVDFGMRITLEAGVTYRLTARYLESATVGTFNVFLNSIHVYDEGVEDPAATCTTDGMATYTCQYCDDSFTQIVPAGHKFVNGVCVRGCGATQDLEDCFTYEILDNGTLMITDYNGSFKHVEIPSQLDGMQVTVIDGIERGAFEGNEHLETLVIPEGVTMIGYQTFAYCSNLKSVVLPQSLIELLQGAFFNCTSLETINLPNNVTFISPLTFFNCNNLKNITVPSSVTQIAYAAFRNCTSLENVTWCEGLTAIDEFAFDNCESLQNVALPTSVAYIYHGAFNNCQNLQSVTIPDNVTSISENAFFNCYNLQTVVLPAGLKRVCDSAFESSWNIKHVLFKGNEQQWDSIVFEGGNWALQEATRHYNCVGNEVTISTSCVGNIFNCSICGAGFSAETNEDTPHQFNADRICTVCGAPEHLQYRIYNGEVQIIWYTNQDDTKPPQDVVIPETIAGFPVTAIRPGAFIGNDFVGSVHIPKTVYDIAYSVFSRCTNLQAITVDPASDYYCVQNNILYSKDMTQLHTAVPSLSGSFTVPASVVDILPSAFFGSKISEIILPQGLGYIGGQAFEYCTNLTKVEIPASVTAIGGNAFWGCENLEEVNIPKTASITTLSYGTFTDCTALKSVTLPDSLEAIEWMAFYNCSSLESIDIPDNVTSIWEEAFYDCVNLETVDFPASLEELNTNSFTNCHSLRSVALPTNVVYISYGAFMNCSSLETVTLPQNLGGIHNSAFQGCSSLETVDVPAGLHMLGWLSFADCGNKLNITFNGDAPGNSGEVFNGTEGNAYYPGDNATWEEWVFDAFGRSITWCPYNISYPVTGSNGDGTITWELTSDGTLTVSGSGYMDYTINWDSYKHLVNDLVIEDGILSVHDAALDGYPNLTTMRFGKDVAQIGWYDLNCDQMAAYVVDPANTTFASVNGVLFTKDMKTLLRCPTGYTGSYTIPTGVTTVSWSAFALCEGITEIIIPDTVETIDVMAFAGTSITEINIPASVTDISTSAFGAIWELMGDPYCSNCDSLTAINVDENNPNYASVDGVLYTKDMTTLLRCPGGYSGSFTVPNSVDSIGTIAFNHCSQLTEIIIPEGVTSIGAGGDATFAGCSDLTALVFPASVADYGFALFARCTNLQEVHFLGTAPSSNMVFVGVKHDLVVLYPEGDPSWEDLIAAVEAEIPAFPEWANIHFEPVSNGGNEGPQLPALADPFVTTCPDSTSELLHICEHNFPDENFRNYVLEYGGDGNVDGNRDGWLTREEAACVQTIALEWWDIYTLEGIQHYTNLVDLWCAENHLTELDLSGNPNLRQLEARVNQITSIDLSVCPNLEFINLDGNPIRTLDVSMLPNLMDLYISETKLTSIDVSQNPQLHTFCCSDNNISSVDLSNNPMIEHLNIGGTGWDMDLSTFPELRVLYCYDNGLTQLDISANPKLEGLHCNGNPDLDTLIVGSTGLSQLTSLNYSFTDLTVDLSQMPNLGVLRCAGNDLDSIDLSNNTGIYWLSVECNNLTELDVSMLSELAELDCSENQIASLDLRNNTNLNFLACFNTGLTELHVEGLDNLYYLDCSENRLGHLDLSGCTKLENFYANYSGLTSVDLTGCDNLMDLMIEEQYVNAVISYTQEGKQYLVDMADFVDSKYLENIEIVYNATYNAATGIATFNEIPYDVHYVYDPDFAQNPDLRMNVFIANECNHNWDETCTSRTCKYCGFTEVIDNHSWTSATCQQPKTCSECGTTVGNVTNHKYGAWITTTMPTAEAEGVRTRTCIWCPATEAKSTPKLPANGKLIENTTDPQQNDCGATLGAAEGTLEDAVLTEEDVANAAMITVTMTTQQIENRDLPDEDMMALDQTFAELVTKTTEEKGEIMDADYINLDIDLHKQLDDKEPVPVHETNKPVEITITVPEHMRDPEPGHNRDFHVIRVHDGEPEFLPHTHDPQNHTVTFHTDRFSTYTLVFVDTLDGTAEEPVYVAAVGGDHYETLGEAIMNAGDGDTVTLMADITEYDGGSLMIERPVTIDLAGKALNVLDEEGNTGYYGIIVFSELTITDSSKNQSGAVNAGFINLSSTGVLNIEAGFIDTEISDESEGCTINLTGGTYTVRPKDNWCAEGKIIVENNMDTHITYSVVDAPEEPEIPLFDLRGSSMTLGNTLEINFAVENVNISEGDYIVVSKEYADGSVVSKTYTQDQWTAQGSKIRYVSFRVTAKEMNDQLTVIVYNENGKQISNTYTDSVAGYCLRKLREEEGKASPRAKYLTLYVDMLNYGAAAQQKWTYNTDALANAELTDVQMGYATVIGEKENILQKGEGYKGTSLSLKDNILLNVAYNTSFLTDVKYAEVNFVSHNGVDKSMTVAIEDFIAQGSKTKYISIDLMAVADYAQPVTVKLYNTAGECVSTTIDSMGSYAGRQTKDVYLYEAILAFGMGAYNYFHG